MPKGPGGVFKGFAYISYESNEEAIRAFAEMDNKIVLVFYKFQVMLLILLFFFLRVPLWLVFLDQLPLSLFFFLVFILIR